jgi:hypothetical protein
MKSVLDPSTRTELTNRINSLNDQPQAQWGKMNVFEMLKHCTICEGMFHNKVKTKRALIGRLIGPMILKKVLKDDKPIGRNSPTASILVTVGKTGDLQQQKQEWINIITAYSNFSNNGFVHPFFGPMTKEQIGLLAYKHADHHLRQFGV